MKLYDFPINETGLMFGVKLLIGVVGDPFLAANLYFLLTFVTAAVASLFVLRTFGVGGQVAVAASVLFAFLPYHFWRGPFHPFASTYYSIPLVTMVALFLMGTEPLFVRRSDSGRLQLTWSWRRTLPAAMTCVLASISGPYFAFFGTFLILTGGLIGLLRKPGIDRMLDALVAAGLLAGFFLAQLIPNVLYTAREGPNPMPLKREVAYFYPYSLRVANLLRPVPGHRVRWLDRSLPPERTKAPPDLAWLSIETNEAEVSSATRVACIERVPHAHSGRIGRPVHTFTMEICPRRPGKAQPGRSLVGPKRRVWGSDRVILHHDDSLL